MMKLLCVLCVWMLALGSTAHAEKLQGPAGSKVQFEIPTGWKVQGKGGGGEGVLVTLSPDEEASIVFAVSEAGNLDKAIKALDGMLGKIVTDAKTDKAGKVTVNGMAGLAAKGHAKAKGKPVKTAVLILQTKGGKVLFVIGLVNAAKKDAYKKTFDEVAASLKPTA